MSEQRARYIITAAQKIQREINQAGLGRWRASWRRGRRGGGEG